MATTTPTNGENEGELKKAINHEMEIIEKEMELPSLFVLTILFSAAFILFMGFGNLQLNNLINFGFPIYLTINSIMKKTDKVQWTAYWVIFTISFCFDMIFNSLLINIPYYFFFRYLFMVWLFLPNTRGAEMIYYYFLKRYNQPYFQNLLKELKELNYEKIKNFNIYEFLFGFNSDGDYSDIPMQNIPIGLNQHKNAIGYSPLVRHKVEPQIPIQQEQLNQQQNINNTTSSQYYNDIKPYDGDNKNVVSKSGFSKAIDVNTENTNITPVAEGGFSTDLYLGDRKQDEVTPLLEAELQSPGENHGPSDNIVGLAENLNEIPSSQNLTTDTIPIHSLPETNPFTTSMQPTNEFLPVFDSNYTNLKNNGDNIISKSVNLANETSKYIDEMAGVKSPLVDNNNNNTKNLKGIDLFTYYNKFYLEQGGHLDATNSNNLQQQSHDQQENINPNIIPEKSTLNEDNFNTNLS